MIQKEGLSFCNGYNTQKVSGRKVRIYRDIYTNREKLEQRQKWKWKKIKKKWNDKTVQASVGEALDQD